MLMVVAMNLLPFLVLGLVNGIVVGLAAALVARALSPGTDSLKFREDRKSVV